MAMPLGMVARYDIGTDVHSSTCATIYQKFIIFPGMVGCVRKSSNLSDERWNDLLGTNCVLDIFGNIVTWIQMESWQEENGATAWELMSTVSLTTFLKSREALWHIGMSSASRSKISQFKPWLRLKIYQTRSDEIQTKQHLDCVYSF